MSERVKRLLLTSSCQYLGSHTAVTLLRAGFEVVAIDSLGFKDTALPECLKRVEEITRKIFTGFYAVNLFEIDELRAIFRKHQFDAVVHFSQLRGVRESILAPLKYYSENVAGLLSLLQVMHEFSVTKMVVASSATVYGDPKYLPIDEDHPVGDCTSPYARTMLMTENILQDITVAEGWNVILLRFFSEVGAHESGRIGDDSKGPPQNLMPFVAQVAAGQRAELQVFGDTFNTKDGTVERDYLHVMDLAEAHIVAVKKLLEPSFKGCRVYNLGTGKPNTVLEVIKAFEKVAGKKIPYKIGNSKPGDVAKLYGDPNRAFTELGWKASRSLLEMCADMWRWQTMNPQGYERKQ
ncbi:UDP-glucose 4-epimerase-like [Tachypleus tridentatus]|uniref:UDP-glucose 4-epimerase-like n=1 Tax=Tachypleus tridentatus TaxID=6853 RepID=UPI003FD55F5F